MKAKPKPECPCGNHAVAKDRAGYVCARCIEIEARFADPNAGAKLHEGRVGRTFRYRSGDGERHETSSFIEPHRLSRQIRHEDRILP